MRIVIAGAGIGGLAAAAVLGEQGHSVSVLEKKPLVSELGAGLQLAPNAYDALRRIGVGSEVLEDAVAIERIEIRDGFTGSPIISLNTDSQYCSYFGSQYIVMHRGDLQQILLRRCYSLDSVQVIAGSEVRDFEEGPLDVVVRDSEGAEISADLLVGADGIYSTVREFLVENDELQISGHTIYRSVVPIERVPTKFRQRHVCLWAGAGWHFVHYPIAGGNLLNLAIVVDNGASKLAQGIEATRAQVLDVCPEVSPEILSLLSLGTGWRSWVLCDRNPIDSWASDRVVLLGDAAHPMLQYAAQGACQALEDAITLGGCLRDSEGQDPSAGIVKYVRVRQPRTSRLQADSRWLGDKIYHAVGEQASWRNRLLGSMGQENLFGVLDWYHRFGGGDESYFS